ncbi:uncharacterized protein EDB91DRAFT_1105110 [Suillus paluster]|uniref:uncharacterized protein n=1 Tax=Suillus paluster TaxID=48578 RepID=UPI001B868FCB|nr:uncharacterized protein EDB91DRAFT_1105110 [Suillus paluster]KAG1751379.1 hypothetical protein EDB91DRAFT_1105110 [Suillus paluster]
MLFYSHSNPPVGSDYMVVVERWARAPIPPGRRCRSDKNRHISPTSQAIQHSGSKLTSMISRFKLTLKIELHRVNPFSTSPRLMYSSHFIDNIIDKHPLNRILGMTSQDFAECKCQAAVPRSHSLEELTKIIRVLSRRQTLLRFLTSEFEDQLSLGGFSTICRSVGASVIVVNGTLKSKV